MHPGLLGLIVALAASVVALPANKQWAASLDEQVDHVHFFHGVAAAARGWMEPTPRQPGAGAKPSHRCRGDCAQHDRALQLGSNPGEEIRSVAR